ncbi:MAG: hypothetical protein JWL58_2197 [Streptosporangiaceae bacterium]|jgi:hypothetical protein|nr:hypothetical protein [Streptosporangiaceae bacterium]
MVVVVVADQPRVPNKETRGAVAQSFVHARQGKGNPSDLIESTPSHAASLAEQQAREQQQGVGRAKKI